MNDPLRSATQRAPETRCDREPIHVPGAVQAHGALLAFDPVDGRIAYRSANLATILGTGDEPVGATVEDLLGAEGRSLTEAAENLVSAAVDAPTAGMIPLRVAVPSGAALDATVHRIDGLVVAELEQPQEGEARRALLYGVRQAVQRLEAAPGVAAVCADAAEEVRRLTGYDRVMIYRFHEDEHGEVVAEARRADLEPFLGLHYPATDIPRPARRLLRLSPTRVIADVDAPPVPLQGFGAWSGRALDLSRSTLRAVSPIHLQYLRNMGVAASLTISLADGARLWGLVACHHGEPRLPSPRLRSACAIVARILWLRIEAHERVDQNEERQRQLSVRSRLLATLPATSPLAEALVVNDHSLLDLVHADGVCLRIDDVGASDGTTPTRDQVEALLGRLAEGPGIATTVVTDSVGTLFPELDVDAATASGMLAVPLGGSWRDHVIWWRAETPRPITWAGDPSKPVETGTDPGDGELNPRHSFAAWRETMRGRATPWSASERSAAAELAADLPAVREARTRDALAKLALRDGLTGLPNRALLLDRIELALADLRRRGGNVCVLFIDLDGFKAVNDTLGHDAGDEVLVEVAARLRRGVRASDTVARLGGDEFVIVCPEDADAAAVEQLAERLRAALAEPVAIHGGSCSVTASIGIAAADDASTPAEALRAADAAMYRAKRQGRNRAAR